MARGVEMHLSRVFAEVALRQVRLLKTEVLIFFCNLRKSDVLAHRRCKHSMFFARGASAWMSGGDLLPYL